MARETVIGIDLGTTNSVVATVQSDQPIVIKNRLGQNLTPSVVAVAKSGKQLVGQIAKRQAVTNPDGTDDPNKQKSDLLRALRGASGPESAAAVVLNAIYARQRADNPALQPAASELR